MVLVFGAEGQKYDYEDEYRIFKTGRFVNLAPFCRNRAKFNIYNITVKIRFLVN